MTTDKFNDSLNRLLEEGRIAHVADVLRKKCEDGLASHPDLGPLRENIGRIADTYGRLRGFLLEGGSDPSRGELYASVKESLRDAGRSYLFLSNENRPDPFFSEYRMQKVRPSSVSAIADELRKNAFRLEMASETEADPSQFLIRRGELLDSLFRKVWSLPPWASDERKAIEDLLDEADYEVSSQIVSALLLGLLKFNDPGKFLLLFSAYEGTADDRIAARALTAIVLILGRWGLSALSSAAVAEAVGRLEESLLTYSRVRDIVMTLIRTRDTDRVNREVTDAFNSTMKEITPEMLERLQREGMTVDASETGFNPEWEKLLANKDFEERMKSLNDMQVEGMDVMMTTFSRLKSFPFFRTLSHWFVPFSESVPEVAPLFKSLDARGFSLMADATEMCASDRFSFALGIMQLPEERREMLARHFGSQLEALRDMMKDSGNVARKSAFATEALVFARDLYRFAKLYPGRRDFFDPFEDAVDFLSLPLVGPLLDGDDIILSAADFYFRYGYYPQALALYVRGTSLVSSAGEAAQGKEKNPERSHYEKMGFCLEKTGDYSGALANYEKADLFSSDVDPASTWLLRKLAFCNKALGRYSAAAECYGRLSERMPEDLSTEFHLGSVLLRAGDIKKGRELISKVHYLDPSHKMAERIHTRLKAHDAFLEGRMADALRLYESARGDQPYLDYRRDLADELRLVDPSASISDLQILLDSGD